MTTTPSKNNDAFEVSLSFRQEIICSFSIRINNHSIHCDLCLKDDYDYNNPDNDPIFLIQSWYGHWEVNLSSKEVIFVDWGFHPKLIIRNLRIEEKRRLIRKCKKFLRRNKKWHWVMGVDYV
jgi:hypothetical protein